MSPEKCGKTADPAKLDRARCLVVLVDVQERLFPYLHEVQAMTSEIEKIVKFANIVEIPVIHIEQIKLGATVPSLAEVMGARQPVLKETFGAFGCQEFGEAVQRFERDTLIIVGAETHVCVIQTVMEALELGYRVQVVADAITSRNPYHKQIALERMRSAGAEITVAESFIFEIMVKANTDEFRKVLPLVK